jgi:hypothetical protein
VPLKYESLHAKCSLRFMKVLYKKAGGSSNRSFGALADVGLPSVQPKQSRRVAALALVIFFPLLGHISSLRADTNSLAAKHENMKRFYEETHKPPPTLAEIKAAAERGDAASQVTLADIYNSKLDYGSALMWYRQAAEQGHTNAQYIVGEMLLNGRPANSNSREPIPADANAAVPWFGRAANQGQVLAQMSLATCYRDGLSVNRDLVEAFKWFALAARQTNALAQKNVEELTLKMRSEEIAVAQSRVDSFVPGKTVELPKPAYLDKLKLSGISGTARKRLAIVNNRTLGLNEETEIKLEGVVVDVKCVEIRDQSVVVQVGPYREELTYRE